MIKKRERQGGVGEDKKLKLARSQAWGRGGEVGGRECPPLA